MRWTCRGPILSLLLFVAILCWTTVSASAATVSAVLRPGQLTINESPTMLSYTPGGINADTQVLDATFRLHITDATGSRAGWHIQANLGALTNAGGVVAQTLGATVMSAAVTPETGSAPVSQFAYPRSFRTDGDTIFSAATGTGAGKSAITFTTELSIPTTLANTLYTTALTVTIASGP